MVGKEGEIVVSGTVVGKSKVDIRFSMFDDAHEVKELVSKVNIENTGGVQYQIGSTKVRGTIKMMPLTN